MLRTFQETNEQLEQDVKQLQRQLSDSELQRGKLQFQVQQLTNEVRNHE